MYEPTESLFQTLIGSLSTDPSGCVDLGVEAEFQTLIGSLSTTEAAGSSAEATGFQTLIGSLSTFNCPRNCPLCELEFQTLIGSLSTQMPPMKMSRAAIVSNPHR